MLRWTIYTWLGLSCLHLIGQAKMLASCVQQDEFLCILVSVIETLKLIPNKWVTLDELWISMCIYLHNFSCSKSSDCHRPIFESCRVPSLCTLHLFVTRYPSFSCAQHTHNCVLPPSQFYCTFRVQILSWIKRSHRPAQLTCRTGTHAARTRSGTVSIFY